MLVKTTQYKSSGISRANLLRALKIFDLPPAISPELNKRPGSNPVMKVKGPRGPYKNTKGLLFLSNRGSHLALVWYGDKY